MKSTDPYPNGRWTPAPTSGSNLGSKPLQRAPHAGVAWDLTAVSIRQLFREVEESLLVTDAAKRLETALAEAALPSPPPQELLANAA